jgi:BMFP domain-containing protein YqiC
MPQPGGRIFDDFSRLMSDATGLAAGMRREVETLVRGQVERLLAAMDVVGRDEHEAVKAMASLARDENERLEARILLLEQKLGTEAVRPPTRPDDLAI